MCEVAKQTQKREVSPMDITTFMIAVFCLIEDFLSGKRLRKRGPQPTLCDSEVLTMEVVGEFLGIDTESKIFTHFCRYYADWFPGLRKITRTTFTRQAADLPSSCSTLIPCTRCLAQRPVIFCKFVGYRSPCTVIFEMAPSISRRSSDVSSTATAPIFSSRRSSFRLPGMGTIHGF